VQCLLFRLFYSTPGVCTFHRICSLESEVSVYSCQGLFVAPYGYQHQSDASSWQDLPIGKSIVESSAISLVGSQKSLD
jgi:hypothetical protein